MTSAENLGPQFDDAEYERQGQQKNRELRRSFYGPKGVPSVYAVQRGSLVADEGKDFMRHEWNWKEETFDKISNDGMLHSAPKDVRAEYEAKGIRPNLTEKVGNPRELKQRFGVFGTQNREPESNYGIQKATPDETGKRVADTYRIKLPVHDIRIDPYGYPYAERRVQPHELERVGHAVSYDNGRNIENHEGKEEECQVCNGQAQ